MNLLMSKPHAFKCFAKGLSRNDVIDRDLGPFMNWGHSIQDQLINGGH